MFARNDRRLPAIGSVSQEDLARQIYLTAKINQLSGQSLASSSPAARNPQSAVTSSLYGPTGIFGEAPAPQSSVGMRLVPEPRRGALVPIETRSIGRVTPVAPTPPAAMSAYQPSLRERISRLAGDLAHRAGAGRYTRQDVEGRVANILDFVPGVGQVVQGNEIRRSIDRGDYRGAGLEALLSALPLAGVALKGGGAAARETAGLRNVPKNVASRSANLYDPPVKPQRDFALDYPKGGVADATGRLQMDMDGRPLTGKYVVGRTHYGGSESGLSADAYDAVAKAGTGKSPVATKSRQQIGQDAGRYVVTRDTRSDKVIDRDIFYYAGLAADDKQRTVAHEIGHMLDEIAGPISTRDLGREPARIYNTLNTGWEQTRNLTGPRDLGYRESQFRDEYMAEAIRAYMADPNYMKTVAPRTAKRIREYVNSNPRLKDIIQFNSLGAGLLGSGLLAQDKRSDAQ